MTWRFRGVLVGAGSLLLCSHRAFVITASGSSILSALLNLRVTEIFSFQNNYFSSRLAEMLQKIKFNTSTDAILRYSCCDKSWSFCLFFFLNKLKQTFTQYVNVSFPVLTNAPWFRDVNHGGSWVRGIENTLCCLYSFP